MISNNDMIIVKYDDPVEKVDGQLLKLAGEARAQKIKALEPYFGMLKGRDLDPLKLQKKWRSDWE